MRTSCLFRVRASHQEFIYFSQCFDDQSLIFQVLRNKSTCIFDWYFYVSIIVHTAGFWLKLDGTLQSLSHFEISTEAWRRAPFPLQGIIIHWPNISNSVNHLTQFMYIQYVNNLTQLITIYNLRERTNGNVFSWQLICRWTIFYTLYKRRWQL